MTDEARLGQESAERMVHSWPETDNLIELTTTEFATAAVQRLAELIEEQPKLFQASRRGSERGAESLSARPFQGIIESIQNGDDLRARELLVAVRKKGRRRELLIVHNGAPISLPHVGAMVLPWVSTKADDPYASGRFGSGQKTLRALGGPIAAHCSPYHFEMGEVPTVCAPEPEIAGFYDPAARDTLLVIPLDAEIDTAALGKFMADLGTRSLVFLHSIRRVALIDPSTGAAIVDHQLHDRRPHTVTLEVHGHALEGEAIELTDRDRRQTYVRYLVEMPLEANERRHNKATGTTTTLGVCVPRDREESLLYDRLPLPVPSRLPVGLNAQFDPDTSRSTLTERAWNTRRFAELGDLVAAVALDLFARDPRRGWGAVPLLHDVPDGIGEWLRERFVLDVIGRCHSRLGDALRIGPQNEQRPIDEIVFDDAVLEDVLTENDQERLAEGCSAVPSAHRDRFGRWRRVLHELGGSRRLDVEEALELLELADEDLGDREPAWYLEFAAAAIEADIFDEFCAKRSVLLADGRRIAPPGSDEPRTLVVREEERSLASRLGLTLPINPVYTEADKTASRVSGKLKAAKLLVEAYESDAEALSLLAKGKREPVRLDDDALLSLRDALEQLTDEHRRELGPKIGRAIELRGFSYDEHGKAETRWISPSTSYLPRQIDRETDSFGRAAAKTPGLAWLSPDYARVLKRPGGRRELGAQGLLVRLGAQIFPRLVAPPNEIQRYSRDPRPATPIEHAALPPVQATEVRALSQSATHLIDDRWSPDLDAVIADIHNDRASPGRKRRAAALIGLLARGWERQFSDHATARAVWGYDGWIARGEVIATWLARAASEPWLPSQTGALKAPLDLHLPSEANRLTVGDKRSRYLMPLDDQVLRSPIIAALRIRRGPSAANIVSTLESLRDEEKRGELIDAKARTAYRILALACTPDGRGQRPVDDMTVSALRLRFAGGYRQRSGRGLLLIDGHWYTPAQVFRGPPIFGQRRPFVQNSPHLEPLWRTLGVELPDAREGVAVLREIARAPLADPDRPVVIETMQLLAREVDEMSPQLRGTLKGLPVWTGKEWTSQRPVYAIGDESVAVAVADQARVWQPGFAIDGMASLVDALGLTLISPEQFAPVANAGYGAAAGDEFRPRFVLAVEHLKAELAQRDQQLYGTLTIPWDELASARLVLDHELEVVASVPGRRLTAPAAAHLIREPLTLFARSVADLGSADGGGRAIADLFGGDRQKVAWAWVAMWQKADDGERAQRIELSSDAREVDEDDRLARLQTQADERRGRPHKTATKKGSATAGRGTTVHVRKLKEIDKFEPSKGSIINPDAPRGGIIIPDRRRRLTTGGGGSRSPDAAADGPMSPKPSDANPTVLPPLNAREQLAYEAVRAALAFGDGEIADLRHRRGVGADAVDELRQSFEIKMSSGKDIPSEITLTPNEVERARTDPDFFLAVVAGLEEGAGDLRVRLIFDPLGRLPLRLRSDLTFGGVRDAEALEYVFPVNSPVDRT